MVKKLQKRMPVALVYCLIHLLMGHPAWGGSADSANAQWEHTLAAAHREGKVTVYGQARHPTSAAIRAFEKVYPKIRFDFIGGSGSQLGPRIMAEKRANKHLVDIAIGGAGTQVRVYYHGGLLVPTRSAFILPEVKDESLWWNNKHHYADPEERFVFAMRGDLSANMGAYNTNLVKPGEIQSWWDLLNPKWQGKIVMTSHKVRGNIQNWRYLYYSRELGPRFIERLIREMKVQFAANERQMMDWLGSGRYAIHLFAKGANTDKAKAQGLPVEALFSQKEAGSIGTGSAHVSMFKKAPHPNAAKIYVNWILSKEGQMSWQKITGGNSLRKDIPKDMLPREIVPVEGKPYMFLSSPQYEDVRPLRRLVDKAMQEVATQ